MITITDKRNKPEQRSTHVSEIPIGTAFYGRVGQTIYVGFFLRTFDGIVLLNNPQKTWSNNMYVTITDYEQVAIEIVVKEIL